MTIGDPSVPEYVSETSAKCPAARLSSCPRSPAPFLHTRDCLGGIWAAAALPARALRLEIKC